MDVAVAYYLSATVFESEIYIYSFLYIAGETVARVELLHYKKCNFLSLQSKNIQSI